MQGNAYNHVTNEAHIDGLGCIDNKTLNFYALDMKTQTALANRIGLKIGINEQHQQPKFVITSPNEEVVYEMTSNLNDPRRQLTCLLYTSHSPRHLSTSRMPSSA